MQGCVCDVSTSRRRPWCRIKAQGSQEQDARRCATACDYRACECSEKANAQEAFIHVAAYTSHGKNSDVRRPPPRTWPQTQSRCHVAMRNVAPDDPQCVRGAPIGPWGVSPHRSVGCPSPAIPLDETPAAQKLANQSQAYTQKQRSFSQPVTDRTRSPTLGPLSAALRVSSKFSKPLKPVQEPVTKEQAQ